MKLRDFIRLTEGFEGIVTVELRDVRKALNIAEDQFSGMYEQGASNEFIFDNEDNYEDFKETLTSKRIKYSIEEAAKTSMQEDKKYNLHLQKYSKNDWKEIEKLNKGREGKPMIDLDGEELKDTIYLEYVSEYVQWVNLIESGPSNISINRVYIPSHKYGYEVVTLPKKWLKTLGKI